METATKTKKQAIFDGISKESEKYGFPTMPVKKKKKKKKKEK